ncbi:MAG: hypothetical protein WCJ75_12400 [Desulfomonile sp.]
MKKFLLVLLMMTIGIGSSAMAQMFVAADGGIAPDGSLNYVFSAGSSFVSGGPIYPMPQPYWINPPTSSVSGFPGQTPNVFLPIPPEQCQ